MISRNPGRTEAEGGPGGGVEAMRREREIVSSSSVIYKRWARLLLDLINNSRPAWKDPRGEETNARPPGWRGREQALIDFVYSSGNDSSGGLFRSRYPGIA